MCLQQPNFVGLKKMFKSPQSLFFSNNELFICDSGNHCVRKILQNGQIVTIAGTGTPGYNGENIPATEAQLHDPCFVFVSCQNQVYISENDGHRVRKIDTNGRISTIAGTGIEGFNGDNQLATHAQLYYPCGLFVSESEQVYIADSFNSRVRMVSECGMISTVAGSGGDLYNGDHILATSANLTSPTGVFLKNNELYIVDCDAQLVRKVDRNRIIDTIEVPQAMYPYDIQVMENNTIYVSDVNQKIIKIKNEEVSLVEARRSYEEAPSSVIQLEGMFVTEKEEIFIVNNNCIDLIDKNGIQKRVAGSEDYGYSGDVPFDFNKYPHIGPKVKKPFSKREGNFVKRYFDVTIISTGD